MAYCSICAKDFKNSQTLATHKYRYHKKDVFDKKSKQDSKPDSEESKQDNQADCQESKQESKRDIQESDQESQQPKAKRIKLYSDVVERYDALERNKILKQLESMERNILDRFEEKNKDIDVGKTINHQKLIMHLCRAVLDGSLPLSKPGIDSLKPHVSDLREIAHGSQKVRKNLIDNHIDQHGQTRGSMLNIILEGALTVLPKLFAL